MENRINVAELLKDCPKGMELYCTMFDNVKFIRVEENDKPICIRTGDTYCYLTKFGTWTLDENAKCVIFPKGKTTWEGFVPPCKFKDGDIVVNASNENSNAFVYAGEGDDYYNSYVGLTTGIYPELYTDKSLAWVYKKSGIRFATEEEKKKLFQAIKENGYKWNAETKTLEKLIEPNFKVGDRIRSVISSSYYTVVSVEDERFYIKSDDEPFPYEVALKNERFYELLPNKFDITTLKPFDKVLVRCISFEKWRIQLFEKYDKTCKSPFICMGYNKYKQCIPYEGNEHLLDTADDCEDWYKLWLS